MIQILYSKSLPDSTNSLNVSRGSQHYLFSGSFWDVVQPQPPQPYTYLRKRSFRPWAAMAVTNPTIIQLPGILSRSRSLALSFHGRRQWTVKRFDIRVRARSGQLRGAASNFEAGKWERGKGKGTCLPTRPHAGTAPPSFKAAAKVGIDNFKSFLPRELRFTNFFASVKRVQLPYRRPDYPRSLLHAGIN